MQRRKMLWNRALCNMADWYASLASSCLSARRRMPDDSRCPWFTVIVMSTKIVYIKVLRHRAATNGPRTDAGIEKS